MDQIDLPDWIDTETWNLWIAYRREDKKKPASLRSQQMTLNKLSRLRAQGFDPLLLIEMAIEHEWQGIYAHEDCRIEARQPSTEKLSAAERFRAASQRSTLRVVGSVR